MGDKPRMPPGLRGPGRRLWRDITGSYSFDNAAEVMLLAEACRAADTVDALDAVVRAEGPMVTDARGMRAHPAAVEARQQRIVLARLIVALRVPLGDEEDGRGSAPAPRLQRRGTRGMYAVRGGAG